MNSGQFNKDIVSSVEVVQLDEGVNKDEDMKVLNNRDRDQGNNYKFNIQSEPRQDSIFPLRICAYSLLFEAFRLEPGRKYQTMLNYWWDGYLFKPSLLAFESRSSIQDCKQAEDIMKQPQSIDDKIKTKEVIIEQEEKIIEENNQKLEKENEIEEPKNEPIQDAESLKNELFEKLYLKCKMFCTRNQKTPNHANKQVDSQDSTSQKIDISELKYMNFNEIAWFAQKSSENSKKVQTLISSISREELIPISKVVLESIESFVSDQFGCYLPRDIIPISPNFKEKCEEYCLQSFSEILPNKFAGHVLRALAEFPDCCSKFLKLCSKRLPTIKQNLQSVLVLATFIKKSPDEGDLDFLIKEFEKINFSKEESHILRLLTNLVERTSYENLNRLVYVINTNMLWLVDDSLGNFGVQILIRKGITGTIDRFKKLVYETSIIALFVNRHRKFVFLEAMKEFGNEKDFFMHILKELMMNTSSLRILFKYEDSAWLFIYLLLKLHQFDNNKMLKKVVRRIGRLAEESTQGDGNKYWNIIKDHLDLFIANKFSSILIDEKEL